MRGGEAKKRHIDLVRSHLMRGGRHLLADIAKATGISEASVSARLRDLRKPMHGGYRVEKERINGTGLYYYSLPIAAPPALAHGKTHSMHAGAPV